MRWAWQGFGPTFQNLRQVINLVSNHVLTLHLASLPRTQNETGKTLGNERNRKGWRMQWLAPQMRHATSAPTAVPTCVVAQKGGGVNPFPCRATTKSTPGTAPSSFALSPSGPGGEARFLKTTSSRNDTAAQPAVQDTVLPLHRLALVFPDPRSRRNSKVGTK